MARKDKVVAFLWSKVYRVRRVAGKRKNGYVLGFRYHWIEAVISTKVTRLLSYQQNQLQLEKMAIESE